MLFNDCLETCWKMKYEPILFGTPSRLKQIITSKYCLTLARVSQAYQYIIWFGVHNCTVQGTDDELVHKNKLKKTNLLSVVLVTNIKQ